MSNKLSQKSKAARSIVAAVLAMLFAGSAACVLASAMGLAASGAGLYFAGLLAFQKTSLRFVYDRAAFRDGSARELLLTGLPACLMTLFENVSYAVLGANMARWGVAAQAGVGVAKKVNMLAHCAVRGIAQGVLPLLGYAYAAGNRARLKEILRIALTAGVSLSALLMGAYLLLGRPLVGLFLPEGESREMGVAFLRILCLGCPFSALGYGVISFFQAVNRGGTSFVLAMLRKGAVDIPLMFLLQRALGAPGLVLATPAADLLCCLGAVLLLWRWFRRTSPQELPFLTGRERMAHV